MGYEQTRIEVQRVCAHVIARERHQRDGHVGLAWTGRGVGTDQLWIEHDGLHRAGGGARPLTSLGDLAGWAGTDLATPFSAGSETPAVGDPDAPLAIEPTDLDRLLNFFAAAWPTLVDLSRSSATAGPPGTPSRQRTEQAVVTLWPEHFDAAFVWRDAANVGASPGDGFSPAPYVYVGPWGAERPGDQEYWNASFGAFQPFTGDVGQARAFIEHGLALLDTSATP